MSGHGNAVTEQGKGAKGKGKGRRANKRPREDEVEEDFENGQATGAAGGGGGRRGRGRSHDRGNGRKRSRGRGEDDVSDDDGSGSEAEEEATGTVFTDHDGTEIRVPARPADPHDASTLYRMDVAPRSMPEKALDMAQGHAIPMRRFYAAVMLATKNGHDLPFEWIVTDRLCYVAIRATEEGRLLAGNAGVRKTIDACLDESASRDDRDAAREKLTKYRLTLETPFVRISPRLSPKGHVVKGKDGKETQTRQRGVIANPLTEETLRAVVPDPENNKLKEMFPNCVRDSMELLRFVGDLLHETLIEALCENAAGEFMTQYMDNVGDEGLREWLEKKITVHFRRYSGRMSEPYFKKLRELNLLKVEYKRKKVSGRLSDAERAQYEKDLERLRKEADDQKSLLDMHPELFVSFINRNLWRNLSEAERKLLSENVPLSDPRWQRALPPTYDTDPELREEVHKMLYQPTGNDPKPKVYAANFAVVDASTGKALPADISEADFPYGSVGTVVYTPLCTKGPYAPAFRGDITAVKRIMRMPRGTQGRDYSIPGMPSEAELTGVEEEADDVLPPSAKRQRAGAGSPTMPGSPTAAAGAGGGGEMGHHMTAADVLGALNEDF